MHKIKHLVFLLLFFAVATLLQAQNGSNSPYTRYGYGDINTTTFSGARAMGGIGIGYRAKSTINPVNPASYSNIDTLTFMFDLGGSLTSNWYKSGSESTDKINGSFDYITLMFPVSKWMGISLGMNPFSTVGYDFSTVDSLFANTAENPSDQLFVSQRTYNGDGGLSQVYAGVSAKFLKHYSVGINAYYLFGNISHYKESTMLPSSNYYDAYQKDNLHIKDFRLRYGVQYFNTYKEKHDLTLGAIFENKTSVNGDYEFTTVAGGISNTETTKDGFDFPMMLGAGFYYTYNKKISAGADFSFQNWSDTEFYGKKDTLSNTYKVSVGGEFLPDPFSRKYYNRIRYRVGATLSNSYVKMDDKFNNFSVTMGFGFPFRRNASILNVGFEYGQQGEKTTYMGTPGVKENYFKVTLSTTFVEKWFVKNVIR